MKSFFTRIFTVYTTAKAQTVRSPLIAIVHVILVILVWCSFLGSIHLDLRKIYQKTCPVHGVVLTKVKGFASTEELTDEELAVSNPGLYRRTWDPSDIVYPAQGGEGETGSFAIVTNLVITSNQSLDKCGDDKKRWKCERDDDCKKGYRSPATNGIHTGRCLTNVKVCEMKGWCPIETGRLPRDGKKALLEDVKDFTVLLKNTVDFPGCGDPQVKNLPSYINPDYLKKCRYNNVSDPLCPVFRIEDIVTWSGDDFGIVAVKGGVFRIKVRWDCDLDFGRDVHDCKPEYKFLRVDDKDPGIFSGMNFRSADFYEDDRRTLRKQYALKILVDLEGEGRRFDFFQMIMKVGATIGLFSVASLVCNCLLSLCSSLGKRKGCGCTAKLSPKIDDLEGNVPKNKDEVVEQGVVHKLPDKDAYHHNHQSIPVKLVNPDVVIERKMSIISNNGYGYFNKAFIGRGSVASIESFKSMTD